MVSLKHISFLILSNLIYEGQGKHKHKGTVLCLPFTTIYEILQNVKDKTEAERETNYQEIVKPCLEYRNHAGCVILNYLQMICYMKFILCFINNNCT